MKFQLKLLKESNLIFDDEMYVFIKKVNYKLRRQLYDKYQKVGAFKPNIRTPIRAYSGKRCHAT